MNRVMLDLETMGVEADAAITQIGAVVFDEGFNVVSSFKATIDLADSMKYGSISAGTIKFWMTHPSVTEEARKGCMAGTGDHKEGSGESLAEALEAFNKFLEVYEVQECWGNGAASDNVWLRSAYVRTGIKIPRPVMFWNDMCLRTMKKFAKTLGWTDDVKREGIYHDSVDDAKHQIKVLKSLTLRLKGELYCE